MDEHFYAVIMAGGGGTRLWPLSRKNSPKQLLKLVGGKSLFQLAVERLQGLVDHEKIYVVTVAEQVEMLRQQVPEIPQKNYLIEPMPKGTAAVVGFAATYLRKIDPDAIMAVLTADHVMDNVPYFQELIKTACRLAEDKTLVTIGILPEFASTGYGYIELEAPFNNESKISEIKKVVKFHEKPTVETALNYINKGNYLWNSGMFFWRLDVFKDEMTIHLAEVGDKISVMAEIFKNNDSQEESLRQIAPIFEVFPDISIDYGLMEKSSKVSVAKALFEWDDVGSWDSLERIKEIDENGNIIQHNCGDDFIGTKSIFHIGCQHAPQSTTGNTSQ